MKKESLPLLLVFLFCIVSCKKDKKNQENLPASEMSNVSYGSSGQQNMDVYLPANRSDQTPVIVFVHGGGFISGDKSEFSSQAKALSAQGFAVMNINYRLVDIDGVLETPVKHKPSAVKISDQLNDVHAAVNFASAKANEWHMSSTKWCITGHSAGGTLAMLYGYSDLNASRKIKAVANLAGATNFAFQDESEAAQLDPRLAEVLYRSVGAEIKNQNKLAFMAVSPLWVVLNGKGIATINIRPEFNSVGELPDGSKQEYSTFTDALNSKSVKNKYVEVAGADHGFSKSGNWDLVVSEVSAFFKTQVK